MLDHAWIGAHIPHQGRMCLLNRVEEWSTGHVTCSAISHRAQDNPLRAHGRLGIACGIEYAAQAMAVHAALIAMQEDVPKKGFLASVRGVSFHASRLDDIAEELLVRADRFSGDSNSVLYDFTVAASGKPLIEGRAAVILSVPVR